MKRTPIGTTAVASLLMAAAAAAPAFAFDWQDLLKNYLHSSQPTGVTADQSTVKSNINARQAQLESEIDAGVASGQLTDLEEKDLRADLNRVAALEGNYLVDNQLTGPEIHSLVEELANVSRRMQTYLTNTTTTGTGTTRHDWWVKKYVGSGAPDAIPSNQRLLQANIESRMAELDTKIDQALSNGRLGWSEARSLRSELNRIRNLETQYLADATLSFSEEQQLTHDLQHLNGNIDREIAEANRYAGRHQWRRYGSRDSVDSRQAWLRRRIDQGRASGQLTRKEYQKLIDDVHRIDALEIQLRGTGARLSYNEERKLLAELDDLSRRVEKELNDRQVR
ncbi:MAG TPA: hypothetical protein V6D17_01200 [Candidatus Obscuribacterales bacterium]